MTYPNVLLNLIDSSIYRTINNPYLLGDNTAFYGQRYINNYLLHLKFQLLEELNQNKISSRSNYVSLKNAIKNKSIQNFHNSILFVDYTDTIQFKNGHDYLVNLVFPCRNSARIIKNSISLLFSEIEKSNNIDFNIIFQINNTFDDTLIKIQEYLDNYTLPNNVKLYILESSPTEVLSLHGSLRIGYKFINQYISNTEKAYKYNFFSFWDDELEDLIPNCISIFNSNISLLLESHYNKAISGYMIDPRLKISKWHEVAKGFSSDVRFVRSKPYLNGGAAMIVKMEELPLNFENMGGIFDTDLAGYLLSRIDISTLENLNDDNWPVRLNPKAPLYHPIEEDILSWTIKYLMYSMAWENTYKNLNTQLSNLWKNRIDRNRENFHRKIKEYIDNLSPSKSIDRVFMSFYYREVQNLTDKQIIYNELKAYRERAY